MNKENIVDLIDFKILIQIRDIIATATKSQTEYRILTSATVDYLHRLGVPTKLQDRVKLWLSYTWEQQKTLGMMNTILFTLNI